MNPANDFKVDPYSTSHKGVADNAAADIETSDGSRSALALVRDRLADPSSPKPSVAKEDTRIPRRKRVIGNHRYHKRKRKSR